MRRRERQGVALSIKDRPAELEPLPGLWRLKLFFFQDVPHSLQLQTYILHVSTASRMANF